MKIRKQLFLLLIIIFLISSSSVKASNTQVILGQQDRIIRNQQNIQEEKRRKKEFDVIKKERKRLLRQESLSGKNSEVISQNNSNCFKIDKVEVRGSTILSRSVKNTLINSFISRCFKSEVLSELSSNIQNYYVRRGYSTTQISIPKQNIASGILVIDIIEGKVSSLTFNDDSLADRLQKFTAFGSVENKILDINEIKQGIYQINRLSCNDAKLKIKPAKEVGYSDVIIENRSKIPAILGIAYNNAGSEFTGVRVATASGIFANLLSLNDETTIGVVGNLDDDSRQKDLRSLFVNFSIPFKYYTFIYGYNRTEFRGTELGAETPLILTGFSDENKFSIERVINSDVSNRVTLNSSLTAKKTASYLNKQKIETSERKLSILEMSLSISKYFENGLNIYFKPSYLRGLKILNAKKDTSGMDADIPTAQFQAYKIYASISKSFIIPKTRIPFQLISEFNGQISKDTLFGSEQISAGGYYSVRGYRENFISGDHGYYSRNSMSLDLKNLLPVLNIKDSKFIGLGYKYLNRISLKPFFDYGIARLKFGSDGGRMSGAGMIMALNDKDSFFEASLTISKGINRSKLTNTNRREDSVIFFDIKIKLF